MPKAKQSGEKELYDPVRQCLQAMFTEKFSNCHLEVTSNGRFSPKLKAAVPSGYEIIFHFLRGRVSPDLTGYVEGEYGAKDFITVEIKGGTITLADVYQAKEYAELFGAKYSFIISPAPVPEEIKRLDKVRYILSLFLLYHKLRIAEFDRSTNTIVESSWYPEPPFQL